MIRGLSIRWLVSGVVLATTLVVLVAGYVAIVSTTVALADRWMVAQSFEVAQVVGDYSVSDLVFGTRAESEANLALLEASEHVLAVALYDAEGRLFSRYVRADAAPALPLPERLTAREAVRVVRPEHVLEVLHPVMYRGEPYGHILLRVSTAALDQQLRRYQVGILWIGAGLLALAFLVSLGVQRVVSRPILRLSRAAEQVALSGDWGTRLEEQGAREVRQLTRSFNELLKMVALREAQRDEAEAARRADAERYTEELERKVEERTAQLAASNRELEAFGYSIAHDLRAPLRSIQAFSSALREEHAAALGEEGLDLLRRIVAAGERMDAQIRDLLEYSRVSAREISLAPVELDSVVREVLDQFAATIAETGARVVVAFPLGRVLGHRATLVQVVSNLVSNALKFVKPGVSPVVRVHSERRPPAPGTAAPEHDADRVRVWVEDEGIGIEPRHQDRVFRLFERLHGTGTYPGTGVGLALVRRGMERMGGGVGVESDGAEGCRFWIELPPA